MLPMTSRHRLTPPNKPLQRSGMDKVLGRGRVRAATKQVWLARVMKPQWQPLNGKEPHT
jgi:hypothetical protein